MKLFAAELHIWQKKYKGENGDIEKKAKTP